MPWNPMAIVHEIHDNGIHDNNPCHGFQVVSAHPMKLLTVSDAQWIDKSL